MSYEPEAGDTSLDQIDAMGKEIEQLRFALAVVDHTLSVHGHIDADTPLHEIVRKALS